MSETIFKSELESKLLALCDERLAGAGFRTVDVDLRVASRSLVRIFLERSDGSGGASIEDCATASRILGPILDESDLIPGAYDLEVSSPGLDRRLRKQTDFEKSVGQDVRLKLRETIEGLGANVTGKLERVEPGCIVVHSQKREWPIPLMRIKQANLVWREERG